MMEEAWKRAGCNANDLFVRLSLLARMYRRDKDLNVMEDLKKGSYKK